MKKKNQIKIKLRQSKTQIGLYFNAVLLRVFDDSHELV